MRDGYLTGFLGLAGLADLQLRGAADLRLRVEDGTLHDAFFKPHVVAIDDPRGRFDFAGLEGDLRFSSSAAVDSELRWSGGRLHGLDFGAARLPFASGDGQLRLREAVPMQMLGGTATFDHLLLRPPSAGQGLEIRFGLTLDRLDIAQLAHALEWPAFTGELTGHIPEARYADDRLDFEGGLAVELFGGHVQVSSLSMERPFGVAPTLSSDIAFEDIDLESLTGVLGFGTHHRQARRALRPPAPARLATGRVRRMSCRTIATPPVARACASASANAPCRTCPASATRRS